MPCARYARTGEDQTPAGDLPAEGAAAAAFIAAAGIAAAGTDYAQVPRHTLVFPQDSGSHPAFRTEWWYVTGWLTSEQGESLGFQVTFFRTKPVSTLQTQAPSPRINSSSRTAHSAIRAGPSVAGSENSPRRIRIGGGRRRRHPCLGRSSGLWRATVNPYLQRSPLTISRSISSSLKRRPCSCKVRAASAARDRRSTSELYYSLPHLSVSGAILRKGRQIPRHRECVVRSRMVQRIPGRAGSRMGLDRYQSG